LKLKLSFCLIIIFASIFLSYSYFDKVKNKKIVFEDTYLFLKKNDNQKVILKKLRAKNIHIQYFDWRMISFSHQDKLLIKAGEYLIPKDFSLFEIQNMFQTGKTITRSFTLIEGSSAINLRLKLLSNKYLSGEIPTLMEGIYKPDTYHFKYGYSRVKLLNRMKKAQDISINKVWKNKPKDFILRNKSELLILASIIQREAKSFEDSKLVASVFINRLRKKMKLQSDVLLLLG